MHKTGILRSKLWFVNGSVMTTRLIQGFWISNQVISTRCKTVSKANLKYQLENHLQLSSRLFKQQVRNFSRCIKDFDVFVLSKCYTVPRHTHSTGEIIAKKKSPWSYFFAPSLTSVLFKGWFILISLSPPTLFEEFFWPTHTRSPRTSVHKKEWHLVERCEINFFCKGGLKHVYLGFEWTSISCWVGAALKNLLTTRSKFLLCC